MQQNIWDRKIFLEIKETRREPKDNTIGNENIKIQRIWAGSQAENDLERETL